jgi:S-(hydroxymethyl)glutathione dehydrogenase/alcohol dehydrogenase
VRAAVYTGPGRPLALEQLDVEPPAPGEVAVRVEAAGVCHSDLRVVEGEWEEAPPIVLGHEGCGIVEAVGAGVSHVAPGDRVVLSWWAPCGTCAFCARGEAWLCDGTRAGEHLLPGGGVRLRRASGEPVRPYLTVGSFAERAVVPASGAIPVPAELPAPVGALIGCAVATGVGAVVNTARVEPGAAVAVVGCGGVGLSIVLGAALAGAGPIVAIDRHAAKLQLARAVGATEALLAGEEADARVGELLGPGGYVFEAIGLRSTTEWAIAHLPRGGTAVLVGMTPTGVTASFDPLELATGGRTILGCTYGSCRPAADVPRLARLHLAGRLPVERLISDRCGLDGIDDAFARMRAGEGARTVVVP